MIRYVYGYDLEELDGEIFFTFRSFPEIISALDKEAFDLMSSAERRAFAEDAVLTALQSIISARATLPATDDPNTISASGFVYLSTLPAMKLQLFKIYVRNSVSIADFARKIGKQDTAARRLLNLRHRSTVDEIEDALAKFGIVLVHSWETAQAPSGKPSLERSARQDVRLSAK